MFKRFLRFLVGTVEEGEEPPYCNSVFGKACTIIKCRANYVHCKECGGRVSEWFTPTGQNLWCRLCNTQTEWNSHEEFHNTRP